MAFSKYKNISEVIQITSIENNFILENPLPIADYFRADLEIVMREGVKVVYLN